ncbi:MAG: TrmB family transcriptional regulator [Candidatus Thorarchaeota archaeon]
MSVSDATLKALKELGLTEYETNAYLSMILGGPQMAASDISSKSQVPYSRIYDVLGRLEEKGFITISKGRPTLYTAKSPTEIVQLVRLDIERRIELASKQVVDELQPLFEQETTATTRDVWLLHGRASILAKALEMLDSSRDSVLLSVPTLALEAEDISPVIDKVLSVKASRVRVLTSGVESSLKSIIPNGFEVRTRDRVFGAGLVIDNRQTLIMLAASDTEGEFLGIYSSAPVFAAMASAYFESLWSDSQPV